MIFKISSCSERHRGYGIILEKKQNTGLKEDIEKTMLAGKIFRSEGRKKSIGLSGTLLKIADSSREMDIELCIERREEYQISLLIVLAEIEIEYIWRDRILVSGIYRSYKQKKDIGLPLALLTGAE